VSKLYDEYSALTERLLAGRDAGTITEEEDDDITEQLDDLWWALSEEDRQLANKRAGEWHLEQQNKEATLKARVSELEEEIKEALEIGGGGGDGTLKGMVESLLIDVTADNEARGYIEELERDLKDWQAIAENYKSERDELITRKSNLEKAVEEIASKCGWSIEQSRPPICFIDDVVTAWEKGNKKG